MSVNLPEYLLKRSKKSRHIRVRILPGGILRVSAPIFLSQSTIDNFLLKHVDWINDKLDFFKKNTVPTVSKKEEERLYEAYKDKAKKIAEKKVNEHNKFYKFSFGRISIRNSKSRWGSCSTNGNLSFNFKIAFLPEPLADYLVVHEICHLKEYNHGEGFWNLVQKTIPDYKEKRKMLKDFDKTFVPPNSNI